MLFSWRVMDVTLYEYREGFELMRYTKTIINGNIAIDSIVSRRLLFRPLTIYAGLFISVAGIILLAAALPVAVVGDGVRYGKYEYILYRRNQHRQDKIRMLLDPFEMSKKDKNRIVYLCNNVLTKEK